MTLEQALIKAKEYANDIQIQIACVLVSEVNQYNPGGYAIACTKECVEYQRKYHYEDIITVFERNLKA